MRQLLFTTCRIFLLLNVSMLRSMEGGGIGNRVLGTYNPFDERFVREFSTNAEFGDYKRGLELLLDNNACAGLAILNKLANKQGHAPSGWLLSRYYANLFYQYSCLPKESPQVKRKLYRINKKIKVSGYWIAEGARVGYPPAEHCHGIGLLKLGYEQLGCYHLEHSVQGISVYSGQKGWQILCYVPAAESLRRYWCERNELLADWWDLSLKALESHGQKSDE